MTKSQKTDNQSVPSQKGRGQKSISHKRERILDAAIVEVAQHGYYKTTISTIARRAGVADGTIYLYFRNKAEILVSIFDRAMARFIEAGKQELARVQGPEARLRRIVDLHLSLVGENRDLAVIFQVELRHSLHFMAQFSRSRIREYLEIIADVIQQGRDEGRFRPNLDPLLAAKAVFGILDEMATDWVLSHRNTRLAAKSDEVADLVLGGLR
jgi:TetR/AcrR family fatty acid metabolism transcriptional regulator